LHAVPRETPRITRGRGGWLALPREGLAPPILCQLAWRTPLGATLGDLLTKSDNEGGLNLSRIGSTAIIALAMIGFILFSARGSKSARDTREGSAFSK
ncbi:MAG: hypothetical protein ABSD90_13960, partial [Methylocystis sp.]